MDIRCFVALELPAEIKAGAGAFTRRLAALSPKVKWVQEQNLHLTLKFLGNTPESRLPAIESALRDTARSCPVLHIALKGTGVFPGRTRPRVVWIGMDCSPALIVLQESIERAMEGLGYPKESREFRAHLTLGRVNQERPGDTSALLKALEESRDELFGEFDAHAIALMKSDLRPSGAVYTRLFEARLGE